MIYLEYELAKKRYNDAVDAQNRIMRRLETETDARTKKWWKMFSETLVSIIERREKNLKEYKKELGNLAEHGRDPDDKIYYFYFIENSSVTRTAQNVYLSESAVYKRLKIIKENIETVKSMEEEPF